METRKADISDIPVLVELRKQQLLDEGLPPVQIIDNELTEYFHTSLTDGSFVAWLAIEDEQIIATGGVCFYRLPPTYSDPTGQIAYITNMFTHREYRKRGIGSALLELVMDEAKARGCKVIRLHASTDGHSLYRKAGFVDSDGYMMLKI